MARSSQLGLTENACLALVLFGIDHGYRLARQFEPDQQLGEVFTLTRPVVYRAIKTLELAGHLESTESSGVRGQLKWTLRCTQIGEAHARAWLDTPVEHIRDIRSELLIKLLIRQAHGLDVDVLIKRQRTTLLPVVEHLLDGKDSGPVAIWRREQARSVMRFLDEYEGARPEPMRDERGDVLNISARNQLRAVVKSVKHGDILSSIHLDIEPGQTMTATITREATESLQLAPGTPIVALCKATDVLVARG
jgi:molybdopterin-binding protein